MNSTKNTISLEEEMVNINTSSYQEEISNLHKNYEILDYEIEQKKNAIPFPEINEDSRIDSYEEHDDFRMKKRRNIVPTEEYNEIKKYSDDTSLYYGHLKTKYRNIYFTEFADSRIFFGEDESMFQLANVDDEAYRNLVYLWRNPYKNEDVKFSRNIYLCNRAVENVDVVYDVNSESFSKINDNYLRKALLRNKENGSATSIIQTIQAKQNDIVWTPVNKSFIVQGCAGSGKTMVLLHRLKDLIYNNHINYSNYLYLVPGLEYKKFIKNISRQFNIQQQNIITPVEYYQKLLGIKTNSTTLLDESVFNPNYLEVVYSKSFLSLCYIELGNTIADQIKLLSTIIDKKITKLTEKELSNITKEFKKHEKKSVKLIKKELRKIEKYCTPKQIDTLDDAIKTLTDLQNSIINFINEGKNTISKENETILKEIIEVQTNAMSIVEEIMPEYDENANKILEASEKFSSKYGGIEQAINELNEYANQQLNTWLSNIDSLTPMNTIIYDFAERGSNVVQLLLENKLIYGSNLNKVPFFKNRNKEELKKYINRSLFTICKNKIYENFNIKLSDSYKHYYYLKLAFRYLSENLNNDVVKYLFIDEAQDLSPAELLIIKRINQSTSEDLNDGPYINLFGDVNQTISKHGTSNWDDLDFDIPQILLNENFRNTNQIIDYCNKQLPFNMTKIGVDMDEVKEYSTINVAIEEKKEITQNGVFIVKDEYAKEDLEAVFNKLESIQEPEIYTVKEVKGLEFKTVCVFDSDMTDNEKYISYTRALATLYVIKELPKLENHHISIIQQANDDETDF